MPRTDAQGVRRPHVIADAKRRLTQLQEALGARPWLVGEEFTVADLMMASVLKIGRRLNLLADFPALLAYQDRCLDRPAYRKAVADQCADIAAHSMEDMRYGEAAAARGN